MNLIACIPARSNSERCPDKNTKPFLGVPLWQRAVEAARASGLFPEVVGGVVVVTDDDRILLGFDHPNCYVHRRSSESASSTAPDILWLREVIRDLWKPQSSLAKLSPTGPLNPPDALVILRPTSPFRTAETIQRAVRQFKRSECHSLRAVQVAKETPYKMWRCAGPGYPMTPVLDQMNSDGVPWHSTPTQTHPPVYMQNACIEIVWKWVVQDLNSLTGTKIVPFFTEGYEGFDINTNGDWDEAERIAQAHPELLPQPTHV
jgi:CMP-N,N'-diacetyllegionaminic acid synthase